MKFLTDFTYRNLHGFARFPGDITALVIFAIATLVQIRLYTILVVKEALLSLIVMSTVTISVSYLGRSSCLCMYNIGLQYDMQLLGRPDGLMFYR